MRRTLPSLNALRAFEAAARLASFRAAGDELCVSPSAVSHQVKILEQYLRTDVFARGVRSVELTKAGQALYPVIRDCFDRMADVTNTVLAPQRQDVLSLRLYSTLTVRWLIPRLRRCQIHAPSIKVRLTSSQGDVDFDREDVDAAVMIGQKSRDDLHYTRLFGSEIFPVCSPALRDGPIPLSTPHDLTRHTILQVYPSWHDWHQWLTHWGIEGVDAESGLQLDSYDHALACAREGVGVALGMQPYVAGDFRTGALIEAFPGMRVKNENEWYFVCRKDRREEAKITAFRRWLMREIADDPDIPDEPPPS
jgi:LysR family glycine cleavage system transcriptional activator